MDKLFYKESATTWEDLGAGIQRKVIGYTDSLMQVMVKFETGAVGTRHFHIHVQSTYVASGVFEFIIGTERNTIHAGEACFMPSNIPHECVCLEAGILIDAFSPARSEFLPDSNVEAQ